MPGSRARCFPDPVQSRHVTRSISTFVVLEALGASPGRAPPSARVQMPVQMQVQLPSAGPGAVRGCSGRGGPGLAPLPD